MQSFIMNSHEVFIHIHQGCFAGTGAIFRLPQCQWSKPDGYGKISQCFTTTKHSKAKTVCIFLGIYCTCFWYQSLHIQASFVTVSFQTNIMHNWHWVTLSNKINIQNIWYTITIKHHSQTLVPINSNITHSWEFACNRLTFCIKWTHISRLHRVFRPGPQFNIKMPSYQYRKSYCGDKTVVRSSYLHNGISYTGKILSLYWIRALGSYY